MSVEELELAVKKLPQPDYACFAAWFAEYQAEQWDRQIEDDLRAGRLDAVIKNARDDIAAGRSKPL